MRTEADHTHSQRVAHAQWMYHDTIHGGGGRQPIYVHVYTPISLPSLSALGMAAEGLHFFKCQAAHEGPGVLEGVWSLDFSLRL